MVIIRFMCFAPFLILLVSSCVTLQSHARKIRPHAYMKGGLSVFGERTVTLLQVCIKSGIMNSAIF